MSLLASIDRINARIVDVATRDPDAAPRLYALAASKWRDLSSQARHSPDERRLFTALADSFDLAALALDDGADFTESDLVEDA